MKRVFVAAAALAAVLSASAASAQSYSVNQAVPWQFRSDSDRIARQGDLLLMEQKKNLGKDFGAGAFSAFGSGSGLLGTGASNTNNFTQIVTSTTNNCTASGAGAALTCSAAGGGNVADISQTTTGTTNSTSSTSTGNTVTNTPTTNSHNTNSQINGNQ